MCFFIGKKHDIQRYMLRFPVQAENNAENLKTGHFRTSAGLTNWGYNVECFPVNTALCGFI